MKLQKRMSLLSLLLLGVMLASCVAPIVVPSTTPVPPTAAPQPPTAMPVLQTTTAPPATPGPAGKIGVAFTKMTSKALANNLIGDRAKRTTYLLLPPSYETSEKRYPVVYVLHEYSGDATSLVEDFQQSYKAALAEGDVQEMIFVFPDASNRFHVSLYLSSPTIGDYEAFLARELVDHIDATYRTIPDRDSRGITGCEMGGDGAMVLALKHPDVFSVVVPASGTYNWVGTGDPTSVDAPVASITELPEDFAELENAPAGVQAFLAIAAVVASNPDKPPFYLDVPITMVNGRAQIVPEIFEKLAAVDPVHELGRYLAQPERLNGIMIFHGQWDKATPVEMAREFDQLLTERGVDHEYLEAQGGHCDFLYQGYVPVVKFLSDHLAGEPAQ